MLAASRGAGLEAVTADKPKVMLPIAGKPLLRRLVEAFKKEGINDITVVGGYRADAIDTSGIRLVVNEKHEQTGELASLACAAKSFTADTVISYGDLLFRSYILRDLVESDSDFCVVVDSSQTPAAGVASTDFAYCSTADDRALFGQKVWLESVTSSAGPRELRRRRKAAGWVCSTCAARAVNVWSPRSKSCSNAMTSTSSTWPRCSTR